MQAKIEQQQVELGDLGTRFERLQGDKDKVQEGKDKEIGKLRAIVTELEGEIQKLKDEAAQDRILSHQMNPVLDINESSISNSQLVHRGGLSPPEDEADSVEIDLNAIGLPP